MTRRALAALALAFALALAGPAAASRPVVLATFQPLYSLAATIVGASRGLEVVCPAPPDEGPHEFDPTEPHHAARLDGLARRAAAIVTLRSLPLAPRFDRLYAWARARRIRVVELDPAWDWGRAAPAFPLLTLPGAPGPNPHVWLAPSLGAELARRLGEDLAALDPRRAGGYRARAEATARRLLELRTRALRALAGVARVEVVALTEGFPYLAADLGVRVVDYLLAEHDPERVAARVRDADVRVVLAEDEPEPAVRRAIEGVGARVLVLHTLEHGFGHGDTVPVDGYERGLAADLDALVEALGGRRAPR